MPFKILRSFYRKTEAMRQPENIREYSQKQEYAYVSGFDFCFSKMPFLAEDFFFSLILNSRIAQNEAHSRT